MNPAAVQLTHDAARDAVLTALDDHGFRIDWEQPHDVRTQARAVFILAAAQALPHCPVNPVDSFPAEVAHGLAAVAAEHGPAAVLALGEAFRDADPIIQARGVALRCRDYGGTWSEDALRLAAINFEDPDTLDAIARAIAAPNSEQMIGGGAGCGFHICRVRNR